VSRVAQELTSQQVVELVRSCSGFRPITFGVTSPSQLTELRLALLFPLCCLLTQVRLGAGDGSSQAEAIAAELQNRVDAADFRDLLQTVRSQIDAQDVSDETLTALLVGRVLL
jgi:hypothetical protein